MDVVGQTYNPVDFLNYVPPGPITADFLNDVETDNPVIMAGIMGPIGCGKTWASLRRHFDATIHCVPVNPLTRRIDSKCLVLRNTYRVIDETVIPTLKKMLEEYDKKGDVTWQNEEPKSCTFTFNMVREVVLNGIIQEEEITVSLTWIFLAIGDKTDPDDIFKGMEYTFVYFNEGDQIAPPFIENALTRLGRYPSLPYPLNKQIKRLAWMDFNAPNNGDYVADIFIHQKRANHRLWRLPGGNDVGAENLDNLPKDYYTNNAGVFSDPNERLRKIDNKLGHRKDKMAVHLGYEDVKHVMRLSPIPNTPLLMAADAGLNPAIVIAQKDAFGCLNVLAEYVGFNVDIFAFAEGFMFFLERNFKDYRIGECVLDPSAMNQNSSNKDKASWCQQFNRETGLKFTGCPTTNSITERIGSVNKALRATLPDGSPAIRFNESCSYLRQGLSGKYHFKKIKGRDEAAFRDTPEKNEFSHICDALQYLCIAFGFKEGKMGEKRNLGFSFFSGGKDKKRRW